MIFKLKDGFSFGWEGINAIAITSKENIKSGNVAYIEVSGRHGKTKTTLSDRFYFVIEGEGKFSIGEQTFNVEKNDVIIVPKNIPYDYEGNMKLILFSTPAFDPGFEVKLK